jgi:5-methylcytosine-specific restriction enzyme subunit McrC
MVDMNAIFEQFVTRLVTNSLADTQLQARAQRSIRAVILDEETGDTYSKIRPDLIIEDTTTKHAVPVDVKYKLYDSAKKISSADIYQSFVYAYSIGADADDPRAGLIYPSTTSTSGPALYIKPLAGAKSARIRGAGIDVPAVLDAIGRSAKEPLHERIRATIRELIGLPQES